MLISRYKPLAPRWRDEERPLSASEKRIARTLRAVPKRKKKHKPTADWPFPQPEGVDDGRAEESSFASMQYIAEA